MSSYGDCVNSLRTSLSFLESSVDTLGNGVSDFPRLISVLKTVRHYELIPQPTLAAAESSLRDEIGPFIALLLDRAERQVDRQARRIETLKARAELQAGRLSRGPNDDDGDGRPTKSRSPSRGRAASRGAGEGETAAALRARMLRQRQEALKYSAERLEMEELKSRLEKE